MIFSSLSVVETASEQQVNFLHFDYAQCAGKIGEAQ